MTSIASALVGPFAEQEALSLKRWRGRVEGLVRTKANLLGDISAPAFWIGGVLFVTVHEAATNQFAIGVCVGFGSWDDDKHIVHEIFDLVR